MVDLTPEEKLDRCQALAERHYDRIRDRHLLLSLPFAGMPLPDGSIPHGGAGDILLPSHTEMDDLGRLISLVLSSWIQSGKMPTVQQLHSSAENMDADPVVYITMLYSMGMLGAFLPVICSGDLDMASATLVPLTNVEEPASTSPNTLSRTTPTKLSGPSIREMVEPGSPLLPSPPGAPDMRSTVRTYAEKKKRSRKPKAGKRLRKKKAAKKKKS